MNLINVSEQQLERTFTYIDEIGSVLAGHSKAKVPPKASVFLNDL